MQEVSPAAFTAMLVNCVAYQNGKKLADIPVEDISEYVILPDTFVWVALFEPTPQELNEMAEEFGLHELAVEDARNGHQRPKLEEYGDSLFAVVHTVDPPAPGTNEDPTVGEVSIFVGKTYVMSIRQRTARGFSDVRARCEREPELLRNGPAFVFYPLLDAITDRYFPVLDDLEARLDSLETSIFKATPTRQSIEQFYDLKWELTTLKHAVAPLLEAVGKLSAGRVPAVCAGMKDYFRDVVDHLARINTEIENLREMLQTAIAVTLALINLSESEVTKKLAAYGALITIPTLIAGVYGMNFEMMPELKWVWGYPFAMALMVAVDGWLVWRFRKAKWL